MSLPGYFDIGHGCCALGSSVSNPGASLGTLRLPTNLLASDALTTTVSLTMCLVASKGRSVSYDISGARDVSTPSPVFLPLLPLVMWHLLSSEGVKYGFEGVPPMLVVQAPIR